MSSEALTTQRGLAEQMAGVSHYQDPEEIMAEAKRAADTLHNVISKKVKKVIFNNQQYLEVEDWQLIGRFYHCTAKTDFVKPVEFFGVMGFHSRAIVVNDQGVEIGAGEALCMTDEDHWNERPVYEWRDKEDGQGREKVHVEDVKVPQYQLFSMAQTRAQSKALRGVFSSIAVLGGFAATPAEEIQDRSIQENNKQAQQQRQGGRPPDTRPISEPQRKRMFALAEKGQWDNEEVKLLLKFHGFTSSADVTRDKYDGICKDLETGPTADIMKKITPAQAATAEAQPQPSQNGTQPQPEQKQEREPGSDDE